MPGLIALMFDEVIVQNEPTVPLYSEHSFVTWRAPLRCVACVAEPAAATARGGDDRGDERPGCAS